MKMKSKATCGKECTDLWVEVGWKVLLLGAGHVASPFVERLLRRPNVALVVASYLKSDFDPLNQIPGASTRLQPEVLDVAAANAGDAAAQSKLDALVAGSDLVVSLLPATLHVGVARLAIRHGVSMVTASYVSPEMKALNDEAEQAGVLILNEVGLDPGIDHLSAMSMVDTARSVGSEIMRFASLCGGLPAPEVAGTNPIGYKFSWSPRGVLVASQNAARWKEDGKLQEVAGVDLLAQAKPIIINNSFALDVLPNRDSTLFAELYGLEDIPTFFRGTLRFRGFCERMLVLSRLGLLSLGPVAGLKGFQGTRRRWLAEVLSEVGAGAGKEDPSQLYHSVRKQLQRAGLHDETGLEFLSWLGLLQDMPLPQAAADCPLDVVAQLLQRPETAYQCGERDMAIMRHELDVRRSDGAQERLVSTLIQYGEPNGHTAMAKTVGLTTAISAELVLDRPKAAHSRLREVLLALDLIVMAWGAEAWYDNGDGFYGRDGMVGRLKSWYPRSVHVTVDVRAPSLWPRDEARDGDTPTQILDTENGRRTLRYCLAQLISMVLPESCRQVSVLFQVICSAGRHRSASIALALACMFDLRLYLPSREAFKDVCSGFFWYFPVKRSVTTAAPWVVETLTELKVDSKTWSVVASLIALGPDGLSKLGEINTIALQQARLYQSWAWASQKQKDSAWRNPSAILTWHCRTAMNEIGNERDSEPECPGDSHTRPRPRPGGAPAPAPGPAARDRDPQPMPSPQPPSPRDATAASSTMSMSMMSYSLVLVDDDDLDPPSYYEPPGGDDDDEDFEVVKPPA
ncbi:AASS [Symbiodinium sp. CCMP2592]|nr:AASS [Symbiodinium sp. CCMP2592]